jgi:hypothetical protein
MQAAGGAGQGDAGAAGASAGSGGDAGSGGTPNWGGFGGGGEQDAGVECAGQTCYDLKCKLNGNLGVSMTAFGCCYQDSTCGAKAGENFPCADIDAVEQILNATCTSP